MKLLQVRMIRVKTIKAHSNAMVLLSTVRKRIRNSVNAVAALNVRRNFRTFTKRNILAKLRFIPPWKASRRVSTKSTRVPKTTNMSKTFIASTSIGLHPRAQNRKRSSTVNQMVKKTSACSMRSSDFWLIPVPLITPRASPASSPSISSRTIIPTTLASMIAVQKSSNLLVSRSLLMGLDHAAPPISAWCEASGSGKESVLWLRGPGEEPFCGLLALGEEERCS
mmetsp:Transcript_21323/g.38990  ORF Transcript_21323/g.38990 Transcript_21323/m.38990 type:complete len:224 (+) Transcript_21323:804-1475(+)